MMEDKGIVGGAMQGPADSQMLADLMPAAKPIVAKAVEILYEDGMFKKLVALFQKQEFHQAMATAINGILEKVGAESGGTQDFDALGQAGTRLFEILLEDLVSGGVVKEVTPQMAAMAIQQTLAMWVGKNGDKVPQDVAKATAGTLAQMAGGAQ